jgi:hypothetical protein
MLAFKVRVSDNIQSAGDSNSKLPRGLASSWEQELCCTMACDSDGKGCRQAVKSGSPT